MASREGVCPAAGEAGKAAGFVTECHVWTEGPPAGPRGSRGHTFYTQRVSAAFSGFTTLSLSLYNEGAGLVGLRVPSGCSLCSKC